MPKSTPSPTNRTANAIESRFSEPTIINPTAVVIDRPIKRLTKTAEMIFAECSAIQRMNSTTSTVPMPLTTAPSATVANSSLAIGTGPVSLTRAPYSPARLRSAAACRMASVASLPGSSALKSRIGLNSIKERRSASVNGLSLTSSRQEKVPEPVLSTCSTVSAICVNGRAVLSSLNSPRLTPTSPVSSAPVSPRRLGSPAMISISGAAEANWLVSSGDLGLGQEQQPVLFEEFSGAERLQPIENAWYHRTVSASARQSPRWSVPASARPPRPGWCCRDRRPGRTDCRAGASPVSTKSAC